MRVTGLLILAFIFVGTPILLLEMAILPELDKLQYTYSHLDEIAQQVAEN